jgi:hypothetical protein
MTPVEIITAARRFHNAEGDTFWSDAELYDYLYFAAMRLATECECIDNRYTTQSVSGQAEYTTPTRAYRVKRVEYNNQKLDPVDFRALDSVDLNSTTTPTGTPQYYYNYDNVFGLYPTPDTSDLDIKVFTYDFPSKPTATSILEIPTHYHDALVYGVRALMSPKELGHPNTGYYQAEWERAVANVRRMERRRRRGDKFSRVLREEDLPNTQLGYI